MIVSRLATFGALAACLLSISAALAQSAAFQRAFPPAGVAAEANSAPPVEVVQPVITARPIPGQLHNAQAIRSFLEKLPPAQGETLTIVQIGDSHTAGDMVTNGWRAAWQGRFGAAGRGMLAVGRPYRGYLTWGVTASQSADWSTNALFGRQHQDAGPALGISGFTQTAAHAGATVSLAADTPAFMFDRFALCGLTGPDQGAVHVLLGATSAAFTFQSDTAGATCFQLDASEPATSVTVSTDDDRPVSLTSWQTSRRAGGLVLANLGVVGSRFLHFARNDDRVIGPELKLAHPDLLVLAFGTNEGFDPTLDLAAAELSLRDQIGRIRRLLGYNVPILLLGPPDAETRQPGIALPGKPETVSCRDGLFVPGNLALIRGLQLRLAKEMGLAFWDWQSAMGGPCASGNWVAQGLQRADHVHFTTAGGRMLGEAIAADLDKARSELGAR